MAFQQGLESFHANIVEIPSYWTLPCFQETVANNILLSDNHRRRKIAITEKRASGIKQTPEAAEHNELFAFPVYRVKEFSMACREKR